MFDVTWEEKLSVLVQQDHQIRHVLLEKGVLSDSYHPESEKVHIQNAFRLQDLILKKGFPVLSNAGERGVRLSWLIMLHAISLPDFMRESLFQMRLAAGQQDYILELLAYMEDRVAFFEGREQLYGTNSDWNNGELLRTPIADIKRVNLRRESMGLPPLESIPLNQGMERPPKDPAKKEKEFSDWLIKVGWRNP